MRARIAELSLTLDGRQRLTLELRGDFREEYDRLKDHELEVALKKYRRRRSLSANAYFWALCGKLAEATGQPREMIYRSCVQDIGGNSVAVTLEERAALAFREIWESRGLGWLTDTAPSEAPGYVDVIAYYGSSVYDTKQMSQLIDHVAQDCRAVGIDTATPEELAGMAENWRNPYENSDL